MDIKACIFDLDGVIVDTAKYHFIAWQELADQLGILFTEEDNERLKGVSRMRSLEIILEIGGVTIDPVEMERLANEKNERYRSYILKLEKSEILPGVIDLLEELRADKIPFALGSASKNAVTILERLDLMNYFSAIVDGTSVTKAKPDPEVFLVGANLLEVDPTHCLVFEDAEAGVEAAKRAGMKVIGIGDPHVLALADWVVPNLEGMTIKAIEEHLNG
jgi:beta-phosphoglucomutase